MIHIYNVLMYINGDRNSSSFHTLLNDSFHKIRSIQTYMSIFVIVIGSSVLIFYFILKWCSSHIQSLEFTFDCCLTLHHYHFIHDCYYVPVFSTILTPFMHEVNGFYPHFAIH